MHVALSRVDIWMLPALLTSLLFITLAAGHIWHEWRKGAKHQLLLHLFFLKLNNDYFIHSVSHQLKNNNKKIQFWYRQDVCLVFTDCDAHRLLHISLEGESSNSKQLLHPWLAQVTVSGNTTVITSYGLSSRRRAYTAGKKHERKSGSLHMLNT